MKNYFTFCCLISSINLLAQSDCGTVTTTAAIQQFLQTRTTASRAGATLYVPIHYHIIGKSNGKGFKKLSEVLESHCDLNRAFASANIQFYIAGIDSIYDDFYYEFSDYSTGDQIMNNYNIDNVCNVYCNKDPRGVCGYAYFPGGGPSGGGIMLSNGCYGTGSTTLIHEMGHYLGLLHTFESFAGIEYVDGSNCNNAGDFFCDTPADFLNNRWTCPYVGGQTDPKGDLYRTVLDGSLFMSYSNDACQTKFSPMQRDHMYNTLLQERAYLLNQPLPNLSAFDSTQMLYPLISDTTVNPAIVTIRWKKIPAATHYLFTLTSNSPGVIYKDTLLNAADTSITFLNMKTNWIYKYRVKPFSYGFTCAPYSSPYMFRTAVFNAATAIAPSASCKNDGSITMSVANGTPPFSYLWNDGDTSAIRQNLTAGNYSVTITDGNGKIAIAQITVPVAMNITGTFGTVGNSLLINATGGVPPYTYLWSDGSTKATSNVVTAATYSVTITDSRGCSTTLQKTTNALADVENIGLQIFPNPLRVTQGFVMASRLVQAGVAQMRISSVDGRLCYAETIPAVVGNNQWHITTSLPQGVYIVELQSNGISQRKKLVVE